MTHKVYIQKVKTGKRGLLYDVAYEGEVICSSTMTPMLDAARALVIRGLGGNLELWDTVRPYPRMSGTVEGSAMLALVDTGNGPRFTKYRARAAGGAQDGDEEDLGA